MLKCTDFKKLIEQIKYEVNEFYEEFELASDNYTIEVVDSFYIKKGDIKSKVAHIELELGKHKMDNLDFAIETLGVDKVITAESAMKNWEESIENRKKELRLPDLNIPEKHFVLYKKELIEKCAQENKQGLADWRLVFNIGLSVREQHRKKNIISEPSDFALSPNESIWNCSSGVPWLYHLINFKGRYEDKNMAEQEIEVKDQYDYCPI